MAMSEHLPADEELEHLFKYHAPHGDQPQRYEAIRAAGLTMAKAITANCPACSADAVFAIRKIREAIMLANAAIAIEESRVS